MTGREQIVAAYKDLRREQPQHPACARALEWLKNGTTYSNEDVDVLQAIISALRPEPSNNARFAPRVRRWWMKGGA